MSSSPSLESTESTVTAIPGYGVILIVFVSFVNLILLIAIYVFWNRWQWERKRCGVLQRDMQRWMHSHGKYVDEQHEED